MSANRKIIAFALVLIVVVGVAGVIAWQQFYKPEKAITGPISVIDDMGRNVTITNYPPERIVSLASSCTEILFALGLGNKVVGVDEYSDYPLEVQERVEADNLTTVGSFTDISIETVVSLQPDLVLATGGVQGVIAENLAELGLPVVVLYPEKFDGVLADISLIGKATGQIDEAEALVADMQERAQEILDKTQGEYRPRVYVEYFFNGGYWTFGSKAYAAELISMAGGTNVFSEVAEHYLPTSTEEVLAKDPEIIIISKGSMAISSGLTSTTIKEREAWSKIKAVQNNQIYEIDEPLIAREGPRLIEGLEEFARIIHPELFE